MSQPKCTSCKVLNCFEGKAEGNPTTCPTDNFQPLISEALGRYQEEGESRKIALAAAKTESEGYGKWTRVQETVVFAKKLGAKKIGLATCVGLIDEARTAAEVFERNGLEVVSACCKAGSIDKTVIGVAEEEKVRPGQFEPICNPISQARIFNELGTELNVVIGLCVGHDILFLKEAAAPSTVLVVKDRILGHNPCAALYTSRFYYRKIFSEPC